MKNKILILLAIFLAGCITTNTYRHGFDENDVVAPLPYYPVYQEKPEARAIMPPGYSYNLNITFPPSYYANCRNAIEIKVENTGDTTLFVYNLEIEINGDEQKWGNGKEGLLIQPGEEKTFILSFKAPSPGAYTYKIGIAFMAKKARWYDYGWKYEGDYTMNVVGYKQPSKYKYFKNYYVYFDRIKKLVDPYDNVIIQAANKACSGKGMGYNIGKVAAIFDYVRENMKYVNDTDGKDEWNSPSIALLHGGDCEEFAMAVAAMVTAEGGAARVYLTDNHAFAAVYIGKDLSILKSIDAYYHANLSYALFNDRFGYWIVADPLSSFYLGYLPVGGYVTGKSGKLFQWSIETNHLYAIDVAI